MESPSSECSLPDILSPENKSRYGRTRRPKVSRDFYNIDDILIDENPRRPANIRTSRLMKSPLKSPIITDNDLGFTRFEDLSSMSIQNSNMELALPNLIHVTKVLEMMSHPSEEFDEDEKCSEKTPIKTYGNRRSYMTSRSYLNHSDSGIVESFGLPDKTIFSSRNYLFYERNKKIDLDHSINARDKVSLPNPLFFDLDFSLDIADNHWDQMEFRACSMMELFESIKPISKPKSTATPKSTPKRKRVNNSKPLKRDALIEKPRMATNLIDSKLDMSNIPHPDSESSIDKNSKPKIITVKNIQIGNQQLNNKFDAGLLQKIECDNQTITTSPIKNFTILNSDNVKVVRDILQNSQSSLVKMLDASNLKLMHLESNLQNTKLIKSLDKNILIKVEHKDMLQAKPYNGEVDLSPKKDAEIVELKYFPKETDNTITSNKKEVRFDSLTDENDVIIVSDKDEISGDSLIAENSLHLSDEDIKGESSDIEFIIVPDLPVNGRIKGVDNNNTTIEKDPLLMRRNTTKKLSNENKKVVNKTVEDEILINTKEVVVDHIDLTNSKKRKRLGQNEVEACSKCLKPITNFESASDKKKRKKKEKIRIIDEIDLTIPRRRSLRILDAHINGPEIDLTLDQDENANGALELTKKGLEYKEEGKEENQAENSQEAIADELEKEKNDSIDIAHLEKSFTRRSSMSQYKLKKKLINSVTNQKLVNSSITKPRLLPKIKLLNHDFETCAKTLGSGMKASSRQQSTVRRKLLNSITNDLTLDEFENTHKLLRSGAKHGSSAEVKVKENINSVNLAKMVTNTHLESLVDPIATDYSVNTKYKKITPQLEENTGRTADFCRRRTLRSSQDNYIKEQAAVSAEILKSEIKKEVIDFRVGDLAWAKIGTFPYWPCLVTEEPKTGKYTKKVVNRNLPLYHVRFFGDNGRRAWIFAQNMMLFYSRHDLTHLAITLKSEGKFKDLYVRECCSIKPTKMVKWESGVREAESVQGKTAQERLNFFVELFDEQRIKRRFQKQIYLKKKAEIENKFVIDLEAKEIKLEKLDDERNQLFFKSPKETPRKNHKKVKRSLPIEESYDDLLLETRDTNDKTREENDEQKLLSLNKNKDISSSDTDSKFSDNSSVPASLEVQAALFRRNNIFKGVSRSKVCQICAKNNNVLKCKGPCLGVYHADCCNKQTEEDKNINISQTSISSAYSKMSLIEKIDYRMKEVMEIASLEPNDSSNDEESKTKLNGITAECLKDKMDSGGDKLWRCKWCSNNINPACQICHLDGENSSRIKCSLHQCGKYYHPACLKAWPQTQWSLLHSSKDQDTFVCPRHSCHTCISDDPRAPNPRCPSDKLVKCLQCPVSYHTNNLCVPAGSLILSTAQIICPRHSSRTSKKRLSVQTINTNWCFICANGGNLICCDTCPTSVHKECLPIELNDDDRFFCEDCQSGRLPLYDEIVWVKLGSFRWWPAVILFPNEIPDNIRNLAHNSGEFVVKFFGTYDYYWVGRGRTFLFQEGDKGHSSTIRKRMDNAFAKAISEAAAAHQLKKQFKLNKAMANSTGLKPPPYGRIKVNRPVGNVRMGDGNISNTTSCECDASQPHPCGPDSDCLNRLLLTECNPEVCPAGDRCKNQCFEKREYPPLIPYRTQGRGWGLRTLAPIRKGQFVIEYVGEVIDEQEYQRRIKKMHEQKEENFYFLTIDKDRTLDAGPKGNVARFMNHSCQPNCETQKWTVNGDTRVGLFATCDIPAETELTFNYNLECIGKEKKMCRCDAPNCSGFIGVKVRKNNCSKKSAKLKKKKSVVLKSKEPAIIAIPCFVCGKTENVGACNNKTCGKVYHLQCVAMKTWPTGNKWMCPWHSCNLCSKRTIRCCIKCINSYCPRHAEANIRYDKQLGFVCSNHDRSKEVEVKEPVMKPEPIKTINKSVAVDIKANVSDADSIDCFSLATLANGAFTSTPLKNVDKSPRVTRRSVKLLAIGDKSKTPTAESFAVLNKNDVKLNNEYPRPTRLSTKLASFTSLRDLESVKEAPLRKRTRLRHGNSL